MEKKLKKVQRGAAFGFVVLKILRILLIIAALVVVAALVFVVLYDIEKLPWEDLQQDLIVSPLSDFGIDIPNLTELIQGGVQKLKELLTMLLAAGVLALTAIYVLMLVTGNLFKHIKREDTPFTIGNVRRLRLLGWLYIIFWACSIALRYYMGVELIRRLNLPFDHVLLRLYFAPLVIALLLFFLAAVFNFGRTQGEALSALTPAPEPAPEPEPAYEPPTAPVTLPEPEPAYEPPAAPVVLPEPEPVPDAEVEPVEEPVEMPAEATHVFEPMAEEAPLETYEPPVEPEE